MQSCWLFCVEAGPTREHRCCSDLTRIGWRMTNPSASVPPESEVLPIGIFARTYPGRTADAVFSAIAASGIRNTQLNLSCVGLETVPDTIPTNEMTDMSEKSNHYRVSISALSGTCNLIHPDPQHRTIFVKRLISLAKACNVLAIPVLTLSTGTRDPDDLWRAHPDNRSAAALDDLRESLRALLDATAELDVTLAFEPEVANVIQNAHDAAALLDEFTTPRLGVILDSANLLGGAPASQQAAIITHAAAALRGRVALAHAKDADASHRVVAPGSGQIDFVAFLRALREQADYTGPVIMHGLAAAEAQVALLHLTAARTSALRIR